MKMQRSLHMLEKLITDIQDKKRKPICIDANDTYSKYIKPYCIDQSIMPFPEAIIDIMPERYPEAIAGVPIYSIELLFQMNAEEYVLFITSEDKPFYQYLGRLYNDLKCYYFMILPCTALDAYFYAKAHINEIKIVSSMLEDERSKLNYELYWQNRISGCVYDPLLYSESPYFGNYIIPALETNDVLVLGGAYDGKHIDRALIQNPAIRAHLFEPNQKYYQRLKQKYKSNEKIHVYNNALYNKMGTANFDQTDELGAKITAIPNGIVVDTIPLDDLAIQEVSLIAMDIEGAELNALEGAKDTISIQQPKLAICAYHSINHYVDIPLYIKSLSPNYRFFFMQHSCYYEESVIYGINEHNNKLSCVQMLYLVWVLSPIKL